MRAMLLERPRPAEESPLRLAEIPPPAPGPGVALVFCALALMAKPNPSSGNVEDQIVQTERAWLAAEASDDLPALRRIVADDFIGTAFGPNVLTKTDIVPPEGASSNRMPKSSLHESTVRVYGDTAVLIGDVVNDDPKQPGSLRVTTVFQKRPQGWQMIAAHLAKAAE